MCLYQWLVLLTEGLSFPYTLGTFPANSLPWHSLTPESIYSGNESFPMIWSLKKLATWCLYWRNRAASMPPTKGASATSRAFSVWIVPQRQLKGGMGEGEWRNVGSTICITWPGSNLLSQEESLIEWWLECPGASDSCAFGTISNGVPLLFPFNRLGTKTEL